MQVPGSVTYSKRIHYISWDQTGSTPHLLLSWAVFLWSQYLQCPEPPSATELHPPSLCRDSNPAHGAKPRFLCMTPQIQWPSLTTELHLHRQLLSHTSGTPTLPNGTSTTPSILRFPLSVTEPHPHPWPLPVLKLSCSGTLTTAAPMLQTPPRFDGFHRSPSLVDSLKCSRGHSGPKFCVPALRKYFLFYLNAAGLFLIAIDSSAPVDQKPQILNTKYQMSSLSRTLGLPCAAFHPISLHGLQCSQLPVQAPIELPVQLRPRWLFQPQA